LSAEIGESIMSEFKALGDEDDDKKRELAERQQQMLDEAYEGFKAKLDKGNRDMMSQLEGLSKQKDEEKISMLEKQLEEMA